jgi:phosphatidylglycerophosphatase A
MHMNFLARIISTGLGVGYFPLARGTMGSLAILIVYLICPEISSLQQLLILIGLTVIGIYTATVTEQEMQGKLGQDKGHDPGIIVVDEIIGMLIALIALPKTLFFMITAFILFRIFDIMKPYPARQMEKLPGGWGIVLDDVIAGIYANLLIQIGRAIF